MMQTATVNVLNDMYVTGYDFGSYLRHLRDDHPGMYDLLSQERCRDAARYIMNMNEASWEFEDEGTGGRGAAYISAQKNAGNRKTGMLTLLNCFAPSAESSGRSFCILDVLGGDGTIAEFCETLGRHAPTIYTADISKFMISASDARGFPSIRQSATRSLFRDDALDGVLIAYGSHHLDSHARPEAVHEAHRTLKAGGRLVLHDFEIGGRCAAWFDKVVDPYSRTGHPHAHFSRDEMFDLLQSAGFGDIRVFEISDPFTLHGASAEEARHNAVMHMHDMYDLTKIAGAPGDLVTRLERLINETLGPISIRQEERGYVAEVPRQALVAVGTKQTDGGSGPA